jgi:hypothetical protein
LQAAGGAEEEEGRGIPRRAWRLERGYGRLVTEK